MKLEAIKTAKITPGKHTIEAFIDQYIKEVKANSIIAISSKIISILEGRSFNVSNLEKHIQEEADFIIKNKNKYGKYITVKHNAFISASGIDQSNGNGQCIFLPCDPTKTARKIYQYLSKKFNVKKIGVIICDSRSMPLRSGATGVSIGFWGFSPLKSYVNKKDIFGRKFLFEKANIVDALAAAAVLVMGEGNEQTPIAIIEDLNFVRFDDTKPNKDELKEFYVSLEDDFFHTFYE